MLEIKDLCVGLFSDDNTIYPIDGLSLKVVHGQTLALIGESGCGKSLTALAILRLLPNIAKVSEESSIKYYTEELLNLPAIKLFDIRGKIVAMIFQDPMTALDPVRTIFSHLEEVINLKNKLSKKEVIRIAISYLEKVRISDPHMRLYNYPHELSGGMKQRVLIAMALAARPAILIADEITTALDVTTQRQILALLEELKIKNNLTMIFITHDLSLAANVADVVALMYNGHIVETATTKEFFEHCGHPYARALLSSIPSNSNFNLTLQSVKGIVPIRKERTVGCRFAERCSIAKENCYKESPTIQEQSSTHKIRCFYPGRELKDSNINQVQSSNIFDVTILQIQDLKVYFPIKKGFFQKTVGYIKACDKINLTCNRGECLAIVGESGCGKSTLAKAIKKLVPIHSGEINTKLDLTKDVQMIFQDSLNAMDPKKTIENIISEGLNIHTKLTSYQCRELCINTLNEVNLPQSVLHRYPHELSGGQRQRVCIARALVLNPKVLICDEITSALDVSVQAQVLNLLKQLQFKHNLSLIFITHDLATVRYMADRINVMYLGRIIEQGSACDVLDNPSHPYVKNLIGSVLYIDNTNDFVLNLDDGEVVSMASPPSGCHYHPRCKFKQQICKEVFPKSRKISKTHQACCILLDSEGKIDSD